MLINSDFERHGFKLSGTDAINKQYKRGNEAGVLNDSILELFVTKSRKGVHNVKLYRDGELISWEAMWSPEQLRIFLLFHKVITDNQKL